MRSPRHWFAATSSAALLTLVGGGVLAGEPVTALASSPSAAPASQVERLEQAGAFPVETSAVVVASDVGTRTLHPLYVRKLAS